MPLPFFSPATRTGEARRRAPAAGNPASPASEAAGDRGKRERGLWGIDPLPHLELGWRAEAARRERAAAVGEICGGGVREARGALVVAAGDAGLRSHAELLL